MVKNRLPMQETPVQSLCRVDSMEKEVASQSSIPASRIPWTEGLENYSLWGHKRSQTLNNTK